MAPHSQLVDTMAAPSLPARAESVSPSSSSSFWARAASTLNVLVRREVDKCRPQPDVDLCEKPGISSAAMTGIIIGVVVGVVIATTLSVLLYFHIKKNKREKQEEQADHFQMSDYGLDEIPGAAPKKQRPGHRPQLSIDDLPKAGPPAGGQPGHLNPFASADDAVSVRSFDGLNPPKNSNTWPKRFDSAESSQSNLSAQNKESKA
ncbi:hypothetical protein B0H67DRAFT_122561 [Lasiosphaeris hirsuta]|uniref:Uncharacterized protein n=1 Tax=Lasiosphaeris hirsuta TaxID=260670 RepID=A0AA40B065_9PEZI|nr:hypothetical protein B0H67DRAFT_122561 [Lasiosphaeris hirsuta]